MNRPKCWHVSMIGIDVKHAFLLTSVTQPGVSRGGCAGPSVSTTPCLWPQLGLEPISWWPVPARPQGGICVCTDQTLTGDLDEMGRDAGVCKRCLASPLQVDLRGAASEEEV